VVPLSIGSEMGAYQHFAKREGNIIELLSLELEYELCDVTFTQ